MAGRGDEGLTVLAALRDGLKERGETAAFLDADASVVVMALSGKLDGAAAFGEAGCHGLEERGELALLSTFAPTLARVLCDLGRLDDAEAWTEKARELGSDDDAVTQIRWRQANAKVLARRGKIQAATQFAQTAVELALATDMLNDQGEALFDLGEVLSLAKDPVGAAEAYERALDCYQRKGNLVSAARTQSRLVAALGVPGV
jgi:tetratricopeptide (TPR) repeat protein